MRHRNVLIIHTDQQRYDSLGCTGNPYADTPNIDRLAREGTLFTRHIAANPVCTPSRCSLVTGLYPPGHGSWANGIALARRGHEHVDGHQEWVHAPEEIILEIPTVADRFAEAGYRTACFGKLHLTPNQAHAHYGFREGRAAWRSGENDGWRGPYCGFEYAEMTDGHGEMPCFMGHYSLWLKENRRDVHDRVAAREKAKRPAGAAPVYQSVVPSELHHSSWLADRFAAYLEQRDGGAADGPFFAFTGFPDPHHPLCPPHDLAELYEDREVLPPVHSGGTKQPHMSNLRDVGHFTEEDRRNVRRYTNAMVKGIDLAVGKILGALERKGMLEETVVVFTSDHGDFLCDHALLTKQNICVEPLVHVPLIVRAPGQGLPSTWDKPVSNVDVMPTVMSLAGLDVPSEIHGCDLSAEMERGLEHQVFAYAFHEAMEYHNMAVYDGDHKLLYYPHIERIELYDLKADPDEMVDLAPDADQRARVEKLERAAAMGLMRHTRAIGHRVCPW